jgi:hypothetical protein
MKQIIPIDNNSRIVIRTKDYVLQYRRKSKSQISWREAGCFPDMTSLCLKYLNASPRHTDNAIKTIGEIVAIIKEAETRICKLIINQNHYESKKWQKKQEKQMLPNYEQAS